MVTKNVMNIDELLDGYIEMLKKTEAIRSPEVERAFRTVPRHKLVETFFVPGKLFSSTQGYNEVKNDPGDPKDEDLAVIYSHHALITRMGENGLPSSSTSMPGLVGDMLELLRSGA